MKRLPRLLAAAGPDAGSAWRENLRALRLLLLVHVGVRSFLDFSTGGPFVAQALSLAAIVVAAVGAFPGLARRMTPIATGLVFGQVLAAILRGGDTANHVFLEGVLLGFLSLCPPEDEGSAALGLQALRWTFAIFLFHTGLQKVLYGYYFDGQYLAYLAATYDNFELVFRHVIPAEELARLQAFNEVDLGRGRWQAALGAGPYRVASPVFVAFSNAVYVLEMGLGVALLVPRTRKLAALGAIALIIGIQAGARELAFGALAIAVLLSYLPRPWLPRLLPGFFLFYAYLVLADHGGLGLLPMFRYAPS